MKNKITRLPLIAVLVSCTSFLALAAEHGQHSDQHVQSSPRQSEHERTFRPEEHPQPITERRPVSRDFVRERLEGLKRTDPAHLRTHAYFVRLVDAGYDPFLLNGWLDSLYGGAIVDGMPGELVITYYGDPLFVNNVVFEGAPALEWGISLRPGLVERVTVAGGKVVHVHG
jgi:hypothetical protein